MHRGSRTILLGLCLGFCVAMPFDASGAGDLMQNTAPPTPPAWAYPLVEPGSPPSPIDDGEPHRVPASAVTITLKQITFFDAPDWHPDGHPIMPDVVVHGRKPDLFACAFCHLPNGQGRPENAALAGLPAAYIVQQVGEIHGGLRRSAQPAFSPTKSMVKVGDNATPADVDAAAAYYALLTYKPWITVVESNVAPKTRVAKSSALFPLVEGGTEPLGDRIIEVPEHPDRTELRDDSSGFVAYVPPGSIHRGDGLAHASSGERMACTACHGTDFRGTTTAPPLAGRSPSYVFRQLLDIRAGTRRGPTVALMEPQVAVLSEGDMRDVAAYVASMTP